MLTISSETPIAALTVQQFRELFFQTPKIEKTRQESSIIDVDTCAEITGYSKSAIYARTSKGLIPCFRRDGKLLFRKDEILNWLTENRVISQSDFSENLNGKLTNKKRPSYGK